MQIRNRFTQNMLKRGMTFLLLFGLFFLILLQFVNDDFFDSDEGDIFANGAGIASGYHLYSELYSQHMPFTYYFSALFWKLGAQSITSQRIAFYFFFALSWTILYFRYQSDVGKIVLIIYPILFCFAICLYSMGTAILSEHLAGLGFVILVLEYFRFCKTRSISISSCLFISFAIILTFGTIFIAAYGIVVVALFVLIKEIQWMIEDRIPFCTWIRNCLKLFLKLAFWCLLPWGILLVCYAAMGNLKDAIYYAYTFNRETYSTYTGGYGSSALEGALSGLKNLFEMVANYFSGGLSLISCAQIALGCLAIAGIVYQFAIKKHVEGCAMIMLIIALATRGIWCFHGTQCIAVLCLLAAIASGYIISKLKQKDIGIRTGVALSLCILLLASPYFIAFSNPFSASDLPMLISQMLDAATEEGEPVWVTAISHNIVLIESKTVPYKTICTPWFSDVAAQEIMDEYPQGPTRVLLHNDKNTVWGYNIQNYAPTVCEYINRNYTHLYSLIYVRNDVYEETKQLIMNQAPNLALFFFDLECVEDENSFSLKIVMQNPDRKMKDVYFAVWSVDGGQDDLCYYSAEPLEEGDIGCTIDLQTHLRNLKQDQVVIHVYGTFDGETQLLRDEVFTVAIP